MRVLVCGGRNYADKATLYAALDRLHARFGISKIIAGGAGGADAIAEMWAKDRNLPTWIHPANWNLYGPSAGPIRNQQMLDDGKPDLVVAFPGGKGTADMARRACEARVSIQFVKVEGAL